MGRQAELLAAIDRLDDLVHNARPVPLTDQVRVRRADAERLVEDIRTQHGAAAFDDASLGGAEIADQLAALVGAARAIPLTDQVRFDPEDVYDLLDRLRAALITDPG